MKTFMCPYIQCNGNAREVVEYYLSVFGGKLDMNTFGEFGLDDNPEMKDKIMHAQLTTEGGMILMVSDNPGGDFEDGSRISITVFGEDEEEIMGYWDKFSADATKVLVPMSEQVWGDKFGMLVDKYGTTWQMNISAPTT
ncbi:VOC family protein [Candidatus Saccharibacteria bacterium]|nr:VOC family protein [Candidatus Saccharibacteria bacterium]